MYYPQRAHEDKDCSRTILSIFDHNKTLTKISGDLKHRMEFNKRNIKRKLYRNKQLLRHRHRITMIFMMRRRTNCIVSKLPRRLLIYLLSFIDISLVVN